LGVCSLADKIKELILFADWVIVDNFDHVLVSNDRIRFLFFGFTFGRSETHKLKEER
jgi:hypothetical protein